MDFCSFFPSTNYIGSAILQCLHHDIFRWWWCMMFLCLAGCRMCRFFSYVIIHVQHSEKKLKTEKKIKLSMIIVISIISPLSVKFYFFFQHSTKSVVERSFCFNLNVVIIDKSGARKNYICKCIYDIFVCEHL